MKVNNQQRQHNYGMFLQVIKSALSEKQFNAVSLTDVAGKYKVSRSIPTLLERAGYVERKTRGLYRATEKLKTLNTPTLFTLMFEYTSQANKKQYEKTKTAAQPMRLLGDSELNAPAVTHTQPLPDFEVVQGIPAPEPVPFLLTWEKVPSAEAADEEVKRAKVPGGWLVKSYFQAPCVERIKDDPGSVAACEWNYIDQHTIAFVPDPLHAWGA